MKCLTPKMVFSGLVIAPSFATWPDQPLSALGKGDDRLRPPAALSVGDHLWLAAFL